MKVWKWIKEYWYIPLTVAGLALLWILTGGRGKNPTEGLKTELDSIEAGRQAQEDTDRMGALAASTLVKAKYQEKMEVLDAQDKDRARTLESDPAALAKFLERATRG